MKHSSRDRLAALESVPDAFTQPLLINRTKKVLDPVPGGPFPAPGCGSNQYREFVQVMNPGLFATGTATRQQQRQVLIEFLREDKVDVAVRVFKKIYLEVVHQIVDHLRSLESTSTAH